MYTDHCDTTIREITSMQASGAYMMNTMNTRSRKLPPVTDAMTVCLLDDPAASVHNISTNNLCQSIHLSIACHVGVMRRKSPISDKVTAAHAATTVQSRRLL